MFDIKQRLQSVTYWQHTPHQSFTFTIERPPLEQQSSTVRFINLQHQHVVAICYSLGDPRCVYIALTSQIAARIKTLLT